MGWFFSDYRVSPNFLLCWGWVVVEVGLGCDNCEKCNIKIVQNTFNEIVLSTDFVEHSSSFDLPAAFLACSEGRLGAARSQKLVIYHAFEQVHCRFI